MGFGKILVQCLREYGKLGKPVRELVRESFCFSQRFSFGVGESIGVGQPVRLDEWVTVGQPVRLTKWLAVRKWITFGIGQPFGFDKRLSFRVSFGIG